MTYDVIRMTVSESSMTKAVVHTFTNILDAQTYADKLNLIAFACEHYIPVPIPKPDGLGMCYKGKQV
ncbi:MAG: hypothetical protein PF440_11885 [Thiomicrorhabdus sp.]|jgi:hypothetical protein|nr:hypothetical protein [Thiomicrorhabdus sp.]